MPEEFEEFYDNIMQLPTSDAAMIMMIRQHKDSIQSSNRHGAFPSCKLHDITL